MQGLQPDVFAGLNAVGQKSMIETGSEHVGTGMAFDPMFYYYRPTNVFAAHGYGPVLLAGSEVIRLIKTHSFQMNDSSIQLNEN
jgi:hypothetical protein